jgi:septation ring formation regulator EzrA
MKTRFLADWEALKKYNALKLATPMMNFMDSFTKAAAHLKATEAYAALKGFQAAVKEADKKFGDIAAKERNDHRPYSDALVSFMNAVKGVNRINDQLRKLEEHLAAN